MAKARRGIGSWAAQAMSVLLLLAFSLPGSTRSMGGLSATANFDIDPQRLPTAVLRYSEQSGVQVTSPAELVEGRRSAGVKGSLRAEQALARLLAGTGLEYDIVDETTVSIRSSQAGTAKSRAALRGDPEPLAVADLRLAQTSDQESPPSL